jgi:hypothetical protein
MEVATLTRVVQIGVESTPGARANANKQFQLINIEPSISADIQTFRAIGSKYLALALPPGNEMVEASISGPINYTELVYLLSSLLTATTPEELGTGAYQWVFAPNVFSEDTVKTLTVETGSPVRAMRFTYGLVTALTFSFTRENAELSGTMIGQRLEDDIQLTSSPTKIKLVPVAPASVSVYMDDDPDDIGTTKLARVLSAELEISDRFSPVWTLDAAQASFATHVETVPTARLALTVEADDAGMGLLAAMREGAKKFVRVLATGPTIGTNNYKLQFDLCGTVTEVGDFSDEDGVYAIEWTLSTAYDADWGKALEVTVVNELSAL